MTIEALALDMPDDDITDFILNKMPVGVMVFDAKMDIVYRNRRAANFLSRYKPPDEIFEISKRIFGAIRESRLKEVCPGDIYFSKQSAGSSRKWTFNFYICEKPKPLVSIFISREQIPGIDLNKLRNKSGLTRKEADILRRMLNGMKNSEVAEDLEISEQTVKDHLSNIYAKFGVENRFDLMRSIMNAPKK